MAEIERERDMWEGNQLKIKKNYNIWTQFLPGFLGALEVQPTLLFACEITPHLVEANVPAIQDEPLEEQAEYDDTVWWTIGYDVFLCFLCF